MNKLISKEIFKINKIKSPKYISLKKNDYSKKNVTKNLRIKKIKFPIVVKPISEGSSIGVKICKNIKQLTKNIKFLFKSYDDLILEPYVGGQEIQVAVINGEPIGAIELKPKRHFYDYKAKYSKQAKTKHMPANLNKKKYLEVLKIAKKAHKVLDCKGSQDQILNFIIIVYLLELNTQPGMTSAFGS